MAGAGYAVVMHEIIAKPFAIPVRVGILAETKSKLEPKAKSKRFGVGAEAIEQLLTTWTGGPVVLGYREDGSVLITGGESRYVALAFEPGVTAIAMASQPVSIGLAAVAKSAAPRGQSVASRNWLNAQPKQHQPSAKAQITALRDALTRRGDVDLGAGGVPKAASVLFSALPQSPAIFDVPWRAWTPLVTPSTAGQTLFLAAPLPALSVLPGHSLAVGAISSSDGALAIAVAWTAE